MMLRNPIITRPCPIGGCKSLRKNQQLMCPGCWRLTPILLQQAVIREAHKEFGSLAHKRAARAAVDSVLERLGIKPLPRTPITRKD